MATRAKTPKKKEKKVGKQMLTAVMDLESKLRLAGEETAELREGVEQLRQEAAHESRHNETLRQERVHLHTEIGRLEKQYVETQQAANRLGGQLKQEQQVRAKVVERVKELEGLLEKLRKVVDFHDYPLRRSAGFHAVKKMVWRT